MPETGGTARAGARVQMTPKGGFPPGAGLGMAVHSRDPLNQDYGQVLEVCW